MRFLKADLRYGLRVLLRQPGFTFLAVLTLAVGIGANTAIFSVLDGVLLRPLPFDQPDRLLRLCETHPRLGDYCVASPANALDWAEQSDAIAELGVARGWQFQLQSDEGPEGVRGGLATGGVFRAFRVQPAAGRFFTDDEYGSNNKVALLSYAYWRSHFGGDPGTVGSTIRLDGDAVTVVGILPADFEMPELEGINIWRPLHFDPRSEEFREWRGFIVTARLADGATVADARTQVEAIAARLRDAHPDVNEGWGTRVMSLHDALVGDVRPALLYFTGAVALVLLIVCANLANLMLARSLGRTQEVAVRAALGASRGRIAGQILVEGLILAVVGGLAGVFLAYWATDLLVAAVPAGLPRGDQVRLDGLVLLFAALVTLGTAVLFTLAPALRGARVDLAEAMKHGRQTAAGAIGRLRGGLVVAEIALALVLLVGAGLLTRTFAHLASWNPGFETEHVLTVSMFAPTDRFPTTESVGDLWRRVEEELSTLPGVTSVSTTSAGPAFGGRETDGLVIEGQPSEPGQNPVVRWYDMGPGYFRTMGIDLVRGRLMTEADAYGNTQVAVVNESAARLFPDGDPIGKRFSIELSDRVMEVVGVVEDTRPYIAGESPPAEVYWSNRQFGRWGTFAVLRTDVDPTSIVPALRDRMKEFDPNVDVSTIAPMEQWMGRRLVRPRFNMMLVGIFAGIALLLAITGVYGVIAYVVAQRSREIGIRMALGAQARQVAMQILRQSGRLLGAGILLGLFGAFATSRFLASMLVGVTPGDPLTFGAITLIIAAAGIAASLIPARRAAAVSPMQVLREE